MPKKHCCPLEQNKEKSLIDFKSIELTIKEFNHLHFDTQSLKFYINEIKKNYFRLNDSNKNDEKEAISNTMKSMFKSACINKTYAIISKHPYSDFLILDGVAYSSKIQDDVRLGFIYAIKDKCIIILGTVSFT